MATAHHNEPDDDKFDDRVKDHHNSVTNPYSNVIKDILKPIVELNKKNNNIFTFVLGIFLIVVILCIICPEQRTLLIVGGFVVIIFAIGAYCKIQLRLIGVKKDESDFNKFYNDWMKKNKND